MSLDSRDSGGVGVEISGVSDEEISALTGFSVLDCGEGGGEFQKDLAAPSALLRVDFEGARVASGDVGVDQEHDQHQEEGQRHAPPKFVHLVSTLV